MAVTTMTSANSLTVKTWEKRDWITTMQRTAFGHAFDRGAVYSPTSISGNKGDQVTFSFANKLTDIPIGEGGTLDGNEEALNLGSNSMIWNVARIGVLNPNDDTIEQHRTLVEFPQVTRKLLTMRVREIVDTSFFYQAAGANPTTLTINGTTYSNASEKLFVQGMNTPVAPSTGRIIRPSGSTDEGLGSTDIMSLDLIDYAIEANERSDQPIERFDDGTFDLYMSPEQMTDLKHNSSAKIQWFNIQLAKITGGDKDEMESTFKSKMICAGRYADVWLYSAPRVAYGVNSSTSAVITTVRRAVLLGKDGMAFKSPFGGKPTDTSVPVKYFAQLKDYEYYKGMEARLLWGLKKMQPSNGLDIGVSVLSTYAAAHTS